MRCFTSDEMCFGESDGHADDIWEARGAGIREDFPPGSGSCDKVVMLVLLSENRRSEEVGIGESHLENSYVFFLSKMSLLCSHF